MKKSILTLGALAVVGGLGLAGSAQAVYYFGPGYTAPTSGALRLNPGSVGNELIIPYYSVEGQTQTLFTIVNTDVVNGKAVKVRFRGATNSDDVLDFTVLMSPGDVWAASVSQDASGAAQINTNGDNTCTLPSGPFVKSFITNRLAPSLSAVNAAAATREGYVEILNMADIPPNIPVPAVAATDSTNYLFNAIKHVNGVPPCKGTWVNSVTTKGQDPVGAALLNTTNAGDGTVLLRDYGLDAPSGGLTGGWMLINQQTMAQFSGNDTAVQSLASLTPPLVNGLTDVMFSPQKAGNAAMVPNTVTADPLLTGGNVGPSWGNIAPVVPLQWYDAPDLSTPFTAALTPTAQADSLAATLGKVAINDEYVNDPSGAVPMSTDWVISQPTRRYFAVVDYSASGGGQIMYNANAAIAPGVYSSGAAVVDTINGYLPYAGLGAGAGNLQLNQSTWGPVACLQNAIPAVTDREETTITSGADFSPGFTTTSFCGEVAVLTWGTSPTDALITASPAPANFKTGWANFGMPLGSKGAPYGLPITGYAAAATRGFGQSFGTTWPLRWN